MEHIDEEGFAERRRHRVADCRAIAAEASPLSGFYGNWKIEKIAGYGEVSSGEADARKGLGQTVRITASSIILPDDPCDKHPLTHDTVQVDQFLLDEWRTSRSDLDLAGFKLGKTAYHIDAACADALVLDKNNLLMSSGAGAFYIVKRSS